MRSKAFVLICFFVYGLCRAQITQGPLNPGTVVSGTCSFSYSGPVSYAPINNIITSNNIYASGLHCGCCDANSMCVRATNFGFTIPASATITGIRVEIEKRADLGSQVEDNGLVLLKSTGEVGVSLAAYGVAWPSFDAYSTYGGCSNLWGTTWTPAEINNAAFGLAFASIDYSCAGNINSFIDHIRVSVCYTDVPLPIGVYALSAAPENTTVVVRWENSDDIRGAYFVVTRSTDGMIYEKVGSLKADCCSEKNQYQVRDEKAVSGINYYKVEEYDERGVLTRSAGPVTVLLRRENTFSINNTYWRDDHLNINCQMDAAAEVEVTLSNLQGQDICTKRFAHPGGAYLLDLELPDLAGGCYLIKLGSDRQRVFAKTIRPW